MPIPDRTEKEIKVAALRDQLKIAEDQLRDVTPTKPYTPAELQVQVIEAMHDLRAELSGSWQGMAETLRDLFAAHAHEIGDHLDDHRKVIREAAKTICLTIDKGDEQQRVVLTQARDAIVCALAVTLQKRS